MSSPHVGASNRALTVALTNYADDVPDMYVATTECPLKGTAGSGSTNTQTRRNRWRGGALGTGVTEGIEHRLYAWSCDVMSGDIVSCDGHVDVMLMSC